MGDIILFTEAEIASKKSTRGKAENPWGETKKQWNIRITPSAGENIKFVAERLGLTKSELIERMFRIDWDEHAELLDISNFDIVEPV